MSYILANMPTKGQHIIAVALAHDLRAGKLTPLEFVERYFAEEAASRGYTCVLPQERYVEYLQTLQKAHGQIYRAAKVCRIHPYAIQKVLRNDAVFRSSVEAIQEYFQNQDLETLEKVSIAQAKKPECYQERKFQMMALNPGKYRPYSKDLGPTNIQINLGVDVPLRRFGMDQMLQPGKEKPLDPAHEVKAAVSAKKRIKPPAEPFSCVKGD